MAAIAAAPALRIIAWRKDLLGGRLLNFAYAWALARLCGVGFRFGQPPFATHVAQSGYDPDDTLFSIFDVDQAAALLARDGMDAAIDPAFVATDPASVERQVNAHRRRTGGEPLPVDRIRRSAGDLLFTGIRTQPIADIDVDLWRAEARRLLLSLPARPTVAGALERLRDESRAREVAVHVRRGDIVTDLLRQSQAQIGRGKHSKAVDNFLMRFVPYATYRRFLAPHPGSSLSLFSDEPAAPAKLRDATGASGYDATRAIQGLETLTKIQRDYAEIRFMADHARIVASQSRFSGVAAIHAGITPVDLSAAGTIDEYVAELAGYGLGPDLPIYAPLFAALQRHLAPKDGPPRGVAA